MLRIVPKASGQTINGNPASLRSGNERFLRLLPLLLLTLLTLVASACRYDTPEQNLELFSQAQAATEITDVLMAQVDDWNSGDVEAFMEAYWQSDSLRFVSNGTVNYGWQATLDNYHRRYPTRESMGALTFSELAVRSLTPKWATVFGRFTLVRSAEGGGDLTGLFTLVFEKQGGNWKVVQDHTSIP